MTVAYESKTIMIKQTPNGCFITDKLRGTTIQVGLLSDINEIIKSLGYLKLAWYSEEKK